LCNFDEDIEEVDKEIAKLEENVKNNHFQKQEDIQEKVDDFDLAKSSIRKDTLRREWDKPKLKEKIWEKHIQKLRNQRKKCFAPPNIYNTNEQVNSKSMKKGKSKKNKISISKNDNEVQDEKISRLSEIPQNMNPTTSAKKDFSNNFFSMYPPPMYPMQPTFLSTPFYNPFVMHSFRQYAQNIRFDLDPNDTGIDRLEDSKSDTK